ncbi:MAG: peptidase [Nitrospinota bacterium]|nr:peptidase [Nitrospinota bacterium]MDH5678868.1 peptidase [Nitrospinota bacterium]MDH5755830.1 peptidase [Nitrospinota bacterium]
MTFCLGMKVRDGLIGLADTRVTTGVEQITARKVTIHEHGRHSMFLMTSGLRSLRDKALTYFEETIEESDESFDKLYKAVNAFARQVRMVVNEDKEALEESGLAINLFSIIGGQLENDKEHKLYLLYPQGNWVEVSEGTPYYIIGESSYGKPILDRVLHYDSSIEEAMKVGYLAFDSTRIAATDVGFPIDMVLYRRDAYDIAYQRYTREDLEGLGAWWQERLRAGVDEFPSDWMLPLLEKSKDSTEK